MPKKTREQIINELKNKYLSEESTDDLVSNTREYQIFEKQKITKAAWYEQLCKLTRKLGLKFSVSDAEHERLENQLSMLGLDVAPEEVLSVSMLSLLLFAIIGVVLFIPLGLPGLLVSFLGFGSYLFLKDYPKRLIEIRQANASSELILAVLYMVIFMRNTSNLEAAVKFVADNLDTALSDDFKKMLWDVSARKFAGMKEALDSYVDKWKDYSPVFVDAIHLIEASLYQGDDEARVKMLDKALDLTLEGTFESMTRYANALRMPINLLYMLGIMLPVLGLVMFPIMGAFLSDIINPGILILLYDVGLPIIIYIFAQYSLAKRPAGFPVPDINIHPDVPPEGRFNFKYGDKVLRLKAWIPAVIVLLVIILPTPFYVSLFTSAHPQEMDVYVTMLIPIAPAIALIIYAKLITKDRLKIRQQISDIEMEFAEAAFQLGNRLSEGYPLEIALTKVASVMGETESAIFFKRISKNITELGMDVERAIFDDHEGAILLYPSAIIKSVMRVAVMSARKSMEVASISLINMSNYLRDVHRIDEKVKDILSETLSSMKFQASFLAPVISGLVVGLTAMILIILDTLGSQVGSLVTGEAGGVGFGAGTWVLGIFQVSDAIPLWIFQPVVGIYVVEVIILLSIIDSQIELGGDKLFTFKLLGSMVPIGMIIYVIATFAVTTIFTGIARVAVTAGVAFG
ncbi:MAG: hypothetical protein WC307_03950 [Candidatus Nanoarchaeia archaeon]